MLNTFECEIQMDATGDLDAILVLASATVLDRKPIPNFKNNPKARCALAIAAMEREAQIAQGMKLPSIFFISKVRCQRCGDEVSAQIALNPAQNGNHSNEQIDEFGQGWKDQNPKNSWD